MVFVSVVVISGVASHAVLILFSRLSGSISTLLAFLLCCFSSRAWELFWASGTETKTRADIIPKNDCVHQITTNGREHILVLHEQVRG